VLSPSELNVFLDCGNYFGDNTNLGDEAVLRGVALGFARHLPFAKTRIATFARGVIHRTCPFFEPEVLQRREDHYSPPFHGLISESDVVGVVFAGAFSDAFAEHALGLLQTLELASRAGKPTLVLSAGFEPVADPELLRRAQEVLPKVDWIACREAVTGPALLKSWGVRESRVLVTGDAALPEAHRYAKPWMGRDIGLSLRLTAYSGLDENFLPRLENPLARLAAAHDTQLVPIPISLDGPSDLEALARFCGPSCRNLDVLNPNILAAEISRCRVVVSGTYHAAVFALAQGIPVITVAGSMHYRTKMGGLQVMFPEGCRMLEPGAHFAEQLMQEAERLWVNAPAIRVATLDRVRRAARTQEEAWTRMMQSVVAQIGSRPVAVLHKDPLTTTVSA
jgi:polysaccharide pyruvyl transferase WcaK-like protein